MYYHGSTGANVGTFLTTFPGSPLVGTLVAAWTGSTRPAPKHFHYPNQELLASEDYRKGFSDKAYRIKRRKVWNCWIVGTAFTVVTVIILNAAYH
jgi:hypothetical protein